MACIFTCLCVFFFVRGWSFCSRLWAPPSLVSTTAPLRRTSMLSSAPMYMFIIPVNGRRRPAKMSAEATSASPEIEDDLSPDEAQARLQALQQVCQELTRKINELDMDRTEHGLVIDALKPLDGDRKCFRMVGDVVVERTIAEVAPAVIKNRDAIVETMNKMGEAQQHGQKRPCPRSSPARPPTVAEARLLPRATLWAPSGEPPPRGCRSEAARGAHSCLSHRPLATQALAQKQKYADAFAAKYKVSAKNLQPAAAAESAGGAGAGGEGGSQGVLI